MRESCAQVLRTSTATSQSGGAGTLDGGLGESLREYLISAYTPHWSEAMDRSTAAADSGRLRCADPLPRISRSISSLTGRDSINARISNWGLDPFEYTADELKDLLFAMFRNLNLIDLFEIDTGKLNIFLNEVEKGYQYNPYHNFEHGFVVAHVCYLFLTRTGLRAVTESYEVLAMLVAALCHDIDHPGHNNGFEVGRRAIVCRRDSSFVSRMQSATCAPR